jgi:DNA-binding NtrC family response regulator
MAKAFRVAIADADADALEFLSHTLQILGHHVVARARTIDQLRDISGESEIDLLIGEVKSDSCLQSIGKWSDTRSIPAILTSCDVNFESLQQNHMHQIFGVLQKPIREVELSAMIVVATQRFHEFEQLRKEAFSLRKALDDRKVIEQAKGIVMKKCGLDEPEAFKHLQHLSRQHRQQLVDVAHGLLIAESAYTLTGNPAASPS